jgi:hypothetical protein
MLDICRQRLSNEERDLLTRVARCQECPTLKDLSERALKTIAVSHGMDFATALIFHRLGRSPQHGPLIEAIAALHDEGAVAGPIPTVAIAPGAFYREDRKSGADGELVRPVLGALGCRIDTVPLLSFGSLGENAAILRRWLACRPSDEKIILMSFSKATAEVKVALADPGAERIFRNVTAWISFSGVYHGTPLVSWLFSQQWRLPLIRLLFWWHDWDFDAVGELERGPGKRLDFEPRLPPDLLILHVLGFPLGRHLTTPLVRRGYRRIARWGPNDGGPNLLADVSKLPGYVYPVWGADHYLRPDWDIRALVTRLFRWVVQNTVQECRAGAFS